MCEVKAFNEMSLIDKKSQPAVQAHVNMMQGIINRMAQNSANCKNWAIPIVSAILMLALEKGVVPTATAYIPLVLFYVLDCYYLGLERKFRDQQRNFITKLNGGQDVASDIFFAQTTEKKCWLARRLRMILDQILCTLDGAFSFSTTIVYGVLALSVYLIK